LGKERVFSPATTLIIESHTPDSQPSQTNISAYYSKLCGQYAIVYV